MIIFIPERAMRIIWDECDRFGDKENGGRIIGVFGNDTLRVLGLIEAGPDAKRTSVSFFQDGDYQEPIFRKLERKVTNIRHLGNWHSHHCNGLETLSSGDVSTYRKNVNSQNHAQDFFYALLVTKKYSAKHFMFYRGDSRFYEIPQGNVRMVNDELLWPRTV